MQPDFNTLPADTVPAVREAVAEIPGLEQLATGYKIATVEQYEDGAGILRRVKAAQKKIEDTRTSITGPMNAALKRVNDFFREPAAQLTRIELSIKNAMTRYSDEQARLAREEQRKADEAAQRERDRLARQAAKAAEAGKAGKAEQLQERASTVVAPVIQREPPKVAGVTTRDVWKFEVVDEKAVPRKYCVVDESKIRRVVQALRGDANIPGVRVYSEKQVAAGAA